jgi:mRNA-degrading endonuclease YafQ of YafQ-DinJ toxin-antitoxin module
MPRIVSTIHISSDFKKSFRKLPVAIQDLATHKDQWFRDDAFDPRLKTHKLKGVLEGYWSYSVNYQYRILFRFISHCEVLYYDIGTHSIYKD